MIDGFLVIDKPAGVTSHDVVQVVRRWAKQRRVGHLGTLDPLATGVLPIALGEATKLSQLLTHGEKSYRGKVRLGIETTTYDREGEVTRECSGPWPTPEALEAGARRLSRRDRAGSAAVLRRQDGRSGRLSARAPRRGGRARAAPREDPPPRARFVRAAVPDDRGRLQLGHLSALDGPRPGPGARRRRASLGAVPHAQRSVHDRAGGAARRSSTRSDTSA